MVAVRHDPPPELTSLRRVGRAVERYECRRKKPYPSKKDANVDMAKYIYRGTMHVYHCHFCGSFHIGHISKEHNP